MSIPPGPFPGGGGGGVGEEGQRAIDEISTEDLLGDYPAVRYYPSEGELFLDIMTRLGEFATYEKGRNGSPKIP